MCIRDRIKRAFDAYLDMRRELDIKKPITLMSLGTILAKELRKNGKLDDLEVSSEINACSVKIKAKVEVDGKIDVSYTHLLLILLIIYNRSRIFSGIFY